MSRTNTETIALLDMMADQTSMQLVGALIESVGTGASEVVVCSDNATSVTSATAISGASSTMSVATGVLTLGRSGNLKMSFAGSVSNSPPSGSTFKLHVELSVDSGVTWTKPGPSVYRDLSGVSYGSFAGCFSGARNSGDMIRISADSDAVGDLTFASFGVSTEWMS